MQHEPPLPPQSHPGDEEICHSLLPPPQDLLSLHGYLQADAKAGDL